MLLFDKIFKSKFPIVRQYDQSDCGPAVLLSVLRYFGGDSSLVHIRQLCATSGTGSTMYGIVNAAKVLGFNAHGAKGEYDDLQKEEMPCIAHVILESGLSHFVVIYQIDENKVLIGDPGKGRYKLSREKFLELWLMRAVILLKPAGELFVNKVPGWIPWIIGYLKKQETWIFQTLFLGILSTAFGLITALCIQWLIDRFIPSGDFDKILYTGLFLFALLIFRAFAGYFRERFLVILNKRINIDINADFLYHIFRIPKQFFDTRKTGDITARINDSMEIQQAILLLANTTIIDGLILIGSLALLTHLSLDLVKYVVIMIPIYCMVLSYKTRKIKEQQTVVMQDHALVESSYINSLQGVDDIIGFNVANSFYQKNKMLFCQFQADIEKLGFIRAGLFLSAEISSALITVFFLSNGAALVVRGYLLLGQMIAAYSLLSNILPAIGRFVSANVALQGANIAAQRLRDILLVDVEVNPGERSFLMEESLTIKDATFSWPGEQPLIKNLNMRFEKGKIIALWGESGAGKSTIVQILQRKYQLNSGDILVDDISYKEICLGSYRRAVAVVPQEISIFNGTILENILLSRNSGTLRSVIDHIEQLGFYEFLQRFRSGLMTIIGEGGVKLSGGEKQILGVIRALYDNPDLLIIDEGFNSMDFELEQILFDAIKKYLKNHIVLLITHDSSIVQKVDEVYVISGGTVVQHGAPCDIVLTSQFAPVIPTMLCC